MVDATVRYDRFFLKRNALKNGQPAAKPGYQQARPKQTLSDTIIYLQNCNQTDRATSDMIRSRVAEIKRDSF